MKNNLIKFIIIPLLISISIITILCGFFIFSNIIFSNNNIKMESQIQHPKKYSDHTIYQRDSDGNTSTISTVTTTIYPMYPTNPHKFTGN